MALKDKIVWITASASGIGRVTALRFAREGAKLAICDINEQALQETKAELENLGVEVLAVPYNAGSIEDIDRVFKAVIEKYGTVDVLVNNAGIAGPTKPLLDVDVAEWDQTLDINLRGVFYCIKLAAPYMIKQGGGKIVNLSSQSGKNPLINRSPYCASKMGVIGLTRIAALELGKHEITVNAVCPGAVAGPRLDFVFENVAKAKGISVEECRRQNFAESPLQRPVPPEDVAEAILFLSDKERSNSVTGEDFNVTCGKIMF